MHHIPSSHICTQPVSWWVVHINIWHSFSLCLLSALLALKSSGCTGFVSYGPNMLIFILWLYQSSSVSFTPKYNPYLTYTGPQWSPPVHLLSKVNCFRSCNLPFKPAGASVLTVSVMCLRCPYLGYPLSLTSSRAKGRKNNVKLSV